MRRAIGRRRSTHSKRLDEVNTPTHHELSLLIAQVREATAVLNVRRDGDRAHHTREAPAARPVPRSVRSSVLQAPGEGPSKSIRPTKSWKGSFVGIAEERHALRCATEAISDRRAPRRGTFETPNTNREALAELENERRSSAGARCHRSVCFRNLIEGRMEGGRAHGGARFSAAVDRGNSASQGRWKDAVQAAQGRASAVSRAIWGWPIYWRNRRTACNARR
jgi:hypothetical protein